MPADFYIADKELLNSKSCQTQVAFAPLSIITKELIIENPEVVLKSYPKYWEDLKSVGFIINLT